MDAATTLRAIAATLARRVVSVARSVALIIMLLLLGLIIWLGSNVSGWWYVFLLPYTLVAIVLLIVFIVVGLFTKRIFSRKLSREQRAAVTSFSNTVRVFAREHGSSVPLLGARVVKDLMVGHNVATLQTLVNDSSKLRSDFTTLQQTLKDV